MVRGMVREAAAAGAGFVLTPEVTNCISLDRDHQAKVLTEEKSDPVLRVLREEAAAQNVWISVGSVGLLAGHADGRYANRSVLIGPDGGIRARYNKIHMFDVNISEAETFRESAAYKPGERAVVFDTPFGRIGMTICYDLRFPHLHRALAQAGADILLCPAAFSPVSGAAHWETLLRARAIETGAYVLAAAQTGEHPSSTGKTRKTYGHSLAVSPWGEVLADAGTDPGIVYVEIDPAEVAKARKRIPSLQHDRPFSGPEADE